MLRGNHGWIRRKHTLPHDSLVRDLLKSKGVERSLERIFLPSEPRKIVMQINAESFIVEHGMIAVISAGKTINVGFRATGNGCLVLKHG